MASLSTFFFSTHRSSISYNACDRGLAASRESPYFVYSRFDDFPAKKKAKAIAWYEKNERSAAQTTFSSD